MIHGNYLGLHLPGDTLLIDEPLRMAASGCAKGRTVEVAATIETARARAHSSAVLVAHGDGTVSIARDASEGGSYAGVDPFGLWWSAQPIAPPTSPLFAPLSCKLRVSVDGRQAEHHVQRHWVAHGIDVRPIREAGVFGLYARPAGGGPFPAVVALGGSSGGFGPAAQWAPLLAAHGFATLVVAYFGAPGLPETMVGIELETVERAVAWLLDRPDIGGDRVATIGISRGGELALLAGSLLDGIAGVAALAPSNVAWGGLDAGGPVDAPAWTFRRQPLPYAMFGEQASSDAQPGDATIVLRSACSASVEDPPSVRHAEIPVEQITGPILLVSGDDDHFWPSTAMAELVRRRATGRGFGHEITHLRYPGAGHQSAGVPGIPIPSSVRHPLTGRRYSFGGTLATNARARIDSWPQIIGFLRETLSSGSSSDAASAGVRDERGPLRALADVDR
jgi:dienelactone hydrolase